MQSARHEIARDEVGGITRAYDKIINTWKGIEQHKEGGMTGLRSHFSSATLAAG